MESHCFSTCSQIEAENKTLNAILRRKPYIACVF